MLNAGADGARRCRCSCRPASSMRSGLQHVTQFCNSTYTTLEDDIILGIANHLNVLLEHSVTQLFWEYNNKTENDSCSLQARALKFIKLFENVSLKAWNCKIGYLLYGKRLKREICFRRNEILFYAEIQQKFTYLTSEASAKIELRIPLSPTRLFPCNFSPWSK